MRTITRKAHSMPLDVRGELSPSVFKFAAAVEATIVEHGFGLIAFFNLQCVLIISVVVAQLGCT
jgi:hypothetical protein